jgi:hypothetical protein
MFCTTADSKMSARCALVLQLLPQPCFVPGFVRLRYVLQQSIGKNKIEKFKFPKQNLQNVGKGCSQRESSCVGRILKVYLLIKLLKFFYIF